MKYLSLFSGIEAATQAWQPLGWECVAVSEIEPFPCAVLAHHYPNVPNLGDVTKITEQQIKDLGQIDLIVFGSPCQNLSVAGNRKGLQGDQSSLFYSAMEIIKYAKRHCKTRFALWENVPGAFSSNKGADFTEVVKHMAGLRELDTPKNGWGKEGAAVGDNGLLEWSVLDAQWFGLAQRRKRVFAIVDFGDWTSRPPILLERESLRGDTPPSRETRESIAADARGCLKARAFTPVSSCLYAAYGTKWNGNGAAYDGSLFALQPKKSWYSLDTQQQAVGVYREGGFGQFVETQAGGTVKASGGCLGGGSETLAVAYLESNQNNAMTFGDESPCTTLPAAMGMGGGYVPMVARCEPVAITTYPINTMTCQGRPSDNGRMGLGLGSETDPCPTLTMVHSHAVAIAGNIIGRTDGNGGNGNGFDESGACYTLTTNDRHAVAFAEPRRARGCDVIANNEPWPTLPAHAGTGGGNVPMIAFAANPNSVVRRLTPIECERLQGFPDNFTKIPYRNKSADDCPNGVRYKALGNSMAVNVMAWIGQKVQQATAIKVYGV